jgi:cell shape-determining protein MreD
MQSGLFKIGWADLGKGVLVAVLTAVVMYLQPLLGNTGFTFAQLNWPVVLNVAITAGVGYILKQFLTSSQGNIAGVGDK